MGDVRGGRDYIHSGWSRVEDVKEREIWVMWEGKGQSAGAVVSRIFDKDARDCCWRFPVV